MTHRIEYYGSKAINRNGLCLTVKSFWFFHSAEIQLTVKKPNEVQLQRVITESQSTTCMTSLSDHIWRREVYEVAEVFVRMSTIPGRFTSVPTWPFRSTNNPQPSFRTV